MSRFRVRLGTAAGEVQEREFTAATAAALRKDLAEQGYHILEVKGIDRGLSWLRALLPSGGKVKSGEFLLFNQQFAALIKAGLPLLSALTLLAERRKNPAFRLVLLEIVEDVRSGQSLSEAFASRKDMFPALYPATLASGERSGQLGEVLVRYVRYSKTAHSVKKKVVSAMVYPSILVAMAIGLVAFLLINVIPSFETFFTDMSGELPALTQSVVSLANFSRTNAPLFAVGLVAGAIALRVTRQSEDGRLLTDRLLLKIPLLGSVLRRYAIAQASRSLHTLLAGGIPVVQALDVGAGAAGNAALKSALLQARTRVIEGGSLWEALENGGEFTDLSIEMVKVGESTGSLADMFQNVADFYDEEVEETIARFVALLEPILLISMGLIVGTLILSVYLPLFTAFSNIGGT